jgi:hypothetical protein
VLCETKTFYVFTILSRIITDICANADLLKIECHSSWISLTITCFWKNKCINLYYKWHWSFRSFHISTYTRVYERCARRNLRTKRNKDFGNKTNSFKLIRHTFILVLIIMSHFHPHPHPHPPSPSLRIGFPWELPADQVFLNVLEPNGCFACIY